MLYTDLLHYMTLRSALQVYGPDPLQHPYSYVLFLRQDARGDMLPCRNLMYIQYNATGRCKIAKEYEFLT
jgi:hypothetical protein